MEHNISLISTLAAGFGVALILGFLAERMKLPALVGYLLAGIAIGPNTPGFVADLTIAAQLSEIGVMLLMFGVGLHFSFRDLLAVKHIAIPGAIGQMLIATLLGYLAGYLWDWPWGQALLFGISLSCASTVVLLKALESRDLLNSMNGKIAVGWLVVEDLATVIVLVLLPPLAGLLGGTSHTSTTDSSIVMTIIRTLLQVGAFIGLMMVVGRKLIPWLLWQIAGTGSRELFTLSVVAAAIGIAFGAAQLFSVSFALGAFFAGMVMRESKFSHRAAEESLPLRDAFSVLFFVSVGMLFDPGIIFEKPLEVLVVIMIILLGKTLAAFMIVVLARYPLQTAFTVAVSLAQIGEFSFILAGLGQALGLMDKAGMSLILAGAIISIALNPFIFSCIAPLHRWVIAHSTRARTWEQQRDALAELPTTTEEKYLAKHVIILGYGEVGQQVSETLLSQGIPFVVAEQNRETVESLREKNIPSVLGDAAEAEVLIQAHIAHASALLITLRDVIHLRQIIANVKQLNPEIKILCRAESHAERELLRDDAVDEIFLTEDALAKTMTQALLTTCQVH